MGMFLTTKEVATKLKVSRQTIITWIKKDGLPAVRIGNLWRIDEYKLNKWMLSLRGGN